MTERETKHLEKPIPNAETNESREKAEKKVFDNLLAAEPFPLLHYTQPSTAARVMVEGLVSIATARESGRHIRNDNNWQGEGQISVTDVEGYMQEQGGDSKKRREAIAREALGIESDGQRANFWNTGGVCLLINPALERYYGGKTHIPRDQAKEDLLGFGMQGDRVRYGGGYSGEAVVSNKIFPEDIYGVVLTARFKDSNLVDAFKSKVDSLDAEAPNDYFHIFNDEINLLELFGMLDEDMLKGIEKMRMQHEKARKLHTALYAPDSFNNIVKRSSEMTPEDMAEFNAALASFGVAEEDVAEVTRGSTIELEEQQHKKELDAILTDVELQQLASYLVEASRSLITTLENDGISTYSELITLLAKSQGIPIYNKDGEVVWPNKEADDSSLNVSWLR